MSKGIYHSELVKRGETAVKVLSDVRQSKFQGKPDYIFIEVDGEERNLSSENADYFDGLILHKGDTLRIRATGSRESAKLEILSGNATAKANSEGSAEPKQTSPAQKDFWSVYRANLTAAAETHGIVLPAEAIKGMSEYEFARLNQVAAISATIQEFRSQ